MKTSFFYAMALCLIATLFCGNLHQKLKAKTLKVDDSLVYPNEEFIYDYRSDVLGEVHDQRRTDWCYAFTASDLLTHYFKNRVSPYFVGIQYYTKRPQYEEKIFQTLFQTTFDYGRVEKALFLSLKYGVCGEEDFEGDEARKGFSYESGQSMLGSLMKYYNKKRNIYFAQNFSSKDLSYDKPNIFLFKKRFLKKQNLSPLKQKLKLSENNKEVLWQTIHESCDEILRPTKKVVVKGHHLDAKTRFKGKKNLFTKIEKVLKSGQILSVALSTSALSDDLSKISFMQKTDSLIGLHTSTLLGLSRNKKTGEISYLIRDSNGKYACDFYHQDFKCHEGVFLVPQKYARKAFKSIIYLKEKK